jgi:hypothetical protein
VNQTDTPTVVLVRGGFADASFWPPVIEDLQAHNVPVLAPPNPLRLWPTTPSTSRATSTRSTGPYCWSATPYGGAMITVAGTSTPNAVGLVYIAAFAFDEGRERPLRRTAHAAQAPLFPTATWTRSSNAGAPQFVPRCFRCCGGASVSTVEPHTARSRRERPSAHPSDPRSSWPIAAAAARRGAPRSRPRCASSRRRARREGGVSARAPSPAKRSPRARR